MKVITLTQPWATLVAIGAKQIETRSWATGYRGPLAIHAAKGLGPVGGKTGLYEIRGEQPFRQALEAAGYYRFDDLPLGGILATCNLTAVYRIPATPQHYSWRVADDHPLASYPVVIPPFQDDQERAFGDYRYGRYAWLLTDVKVLPEPIPAKGALGLWEWDSASLLELS